ncbi:MAG: transposase [Acidimicrobiales bacterium]
MPRHYPAEVRHEACERMLAGEAIEDLADELGITIETLYRWRRQALIDTGQAPRGQELRGRSAGGSPSAHPSARGRARDGQGGQCDLRGGRDRPKRRFRVVRRMNNLGYSE